MESAFRKKYPNLSEEDFGDYIATKKTKYDESKDPYYQKSQKLAGDAYTLSKGYVPAQAAGSAFISAAMVAPVAAIVTKKRVKSGKVAAAAAIASVGILTVAGAVEAKKEQREVYNKYKDD